MDSVNEAEDANSDKIFDEHGSIPTSDGATSFKSPAPEPQEEKEVVAGFLFVNLPGRSRASVLCKSFEDHFSWMITLRILFILQRLY